VLQKKSFFFVKSLKIVSRYPYIIQKVERVLFLKEKKNGKQKQNQDYFNYKHILFLKKIKILKQQQQQNKMCTSTLFFIFFSFFFLSFLF
jgi:hypothetical protein